MDALIIRMFGEFSITNKYHEFVATTSNHNQVILLLSYLIANHNIKVSKQKLIEILWPNADCSNPAGALRNLIYRARKELAAFFPEETTECIVLSRNSYYLNKEIPFQLDIYDFEKAFALAQQQNDAEHKYRYYLKMMQLYTGSFLPVQASEEWVLYRSVYYQRMFSHAVLSIITYLNTKEHYEYILQVCNHAIEVEPSDENIHLEKLRALLNLGKIQQGLEYYTQITELFSQKYSIDITESFREVYKDLLCAIPSNGITMNALEKNLRSTDKDDRGFFCNFDVFKKIYQLNLHFAHRYQSRCFLLLLTLRSKTSSETPLPQLRTAMSLLHDILSETLRNSDVFTQSSLFQFSLILTVPNEKNCQIAVKRLKKAFASRCTIPNLLLETTIRPIF